MTLHPRPLNFQIYEENLIFFFYQCTTYVYRQGLDTSFTINFGPETLALTFVRATSDLWGIGRRHDCI